MKNVLLIFFAVLCLSLTACTTANAVPKAKLTFNPRTGVVEVSNPKDVELQNVVVTVAMTNGMRLVQFQIGSYKTINNPDVIEKSAAGTAAMVNAGADVGAKYFAAGLQAAAAAMLPKVPVPSIPSPQK